MKEGLIKDTTELILKEIQSILSISYIVIVAIGMLFNYQKYEEFGINIFDYADVLEFLIAPFSDPMIFLFSVASLIFIATIITLDALWKVRRPKSYSKFNFGLDKKRWFNVYRYALYGTLVIYYLYMSADIYGDFKYDFILESEPVKVHFEDGSDQKGKLIGKTKDVIFLLQDKKVKAIPFTSVVKEFEIFQLK